MRIAISVLTLAFVGALVGPSGIKAMAAMPTAAEASLVNSDGKSAGHAAFVQTSEGVKMTIDATGLAPGAHGIHLHAVGSCLAPDFASAGSHWNPMHKMHGRNAPNGFHAGDLPNIMIDSSGKGHLETLIAGATLDAGMMGLLDADGTALVIHAAADDNVTDPSGNSGKRLECGVVTAR